MNLSEILTRSLVLRLSLGVIVAGVLIAYIGSGGIDFGLSEKKMPTVWLKCFSPVSPEDQYVWDIKKHGGGEIIIPNDGCPTQLVMAPNKENHEFCPLAEVEIKRFYTDLSEDKDFWLLVPGTENPPKKTVRAFQFRNKGPRNVYLYVVRGSCPL